MKKTITFCLVLICICVSLRQALQITEVSSENKYPFQGCSTRNPVQDVMIIPESDPFFGIISTSVACWYDTATNITGLVPLLVQNQGIFTDQEQRFLNTYLEGKNRTLLVLGDHINTTFQTKEILGSVVDVAGILATQVFTQTSTLMIIPYGTNEAYQLSLIAAPPLQAI